ncbi:focadhesin isoform X2 [Haemaphysalis longicornis]
MEDVRAMLNFDAPCVQRKAVQKLLHAIGLQHKPGTPPLSAESPKCRELELLVEQCGAGQRASEECCEALLSLVVSGQLDWRYALSQLLGRACCRSIGDDDKATSPDDRLVGQQQPSAAVAAVGRLLVLHMRGELQSGVPYVCPFALRNHPLVLVLKERPDCWDVVLQAVQEALLDCSGPTALELIRPLVLHCLVGPTQPVEHGPLRLWLWLALAQRWPHWLRTLLPWMPVVGGQLAVLEQLLPLKGGPDVLLHTLAACLLAMDMGMGCRRATLRALCSAHCILRAGEAGDTKALSAGERPLWDACVVLAAMLLARSPGPCLADALELCEALVDAVCPGGEGGGGPLAQCLSLPLCELLQQQQLPRNLQPRAASLLGRVAAPSHAGAPPEGDGTVSGRSGEQVSPEEVDPTVWASSSSLHPLVAGALFTAQCLHLPPKESVECWRGLSGILIGGRDGAFLGALVASSALLGSSTLEDATMALDALRRAVDDCSQLGPSVLPLLLQALARSHSPDILALVLRSLPDTATHKYALGPLWSAVRALSRHHPTLASVLLPSLATLCGRQPQALPLVLQALGGDDLRKEGDKKKAGSKSGDDILALAKARAIQVLLEDNASQLKADLLGPLVSLVTGCRGDRQGAAVVLALRCIYQLCAAEVADVKTTLSAIVPKLWNDDRPLVVRAVCELLAVVPLASVPTTEYERYEQETAGRLWRAASSRDKHVAVRGGAFRALAAFPSSCHQLKQLPDEAKAKLKPPASKTPLDLGRPLEELFTYTPGHCFLDLLAALDEDQQLLKDYGHLLSSLVRQEVRELPRSVYTRPKAVATPGGRDANFGQQLCSLYEGNRFPAIQGSLAVGALLTYEPAAAAQAGAKGKPGPSVHEGYLHLLPSLLQDVPLDGADWVRCLAVAPAWGSWVRRAFRAADEARRRELRGDPQALATSWLWARDALTEAIRENCTGRASQQGNALLALCSLLEATGEHVQGQDPTAAAAQAAHLSSSGHAQWASALLDLVLDSCLTSPRGERGGYEASFERAGPFNWLLKGSVKSGLSSALGRGCAAVAAGGLLGLLHRRDPRCVVPLVEGLANRLEAGEGGATGQTLTGVGLAGCVAAAAHLGLLEEASSETAGLRSLVLRVVRNLLSTCLGNDLCEPKPGQLLCLALCLCTLSRMAVTDEAMREVVIDGCARFCQDLRGADPDACSFEVRCVCTSLVVCCASGANLLSLSNVEELLLWFEKRRQEQPQCQGTAMSVGLLVRTLVERAHPKGPLLWASLASHWTATVLSQSQPTLSRLAALRGLCMMVLGAQVLLGSANSSEESGAGGEQTGETERRQLQEQLLRLVSRSSPQEAPLASCAAWALGQLTGGSNAQAARSGATSAPSTYGYLGEASILKPLVNFMASSIKTESWGARLGACLSVLDQDFGRALPPLNWTALLGPLLRLGPVSHAEQAVSAALRGAPSSPAMAAFLVACATPPLLHSLPETCVEGLLLRGLVPVVRAAPSSKLGPFLQMAAHRALQPGGPTVLQAVESLLREEEEGEKGEKGAEASPSLFGPKRKGALPLLCELLKAVARGCQDDVWDAQQRGLLTVLGRCVALLTPATRAALVDAVEAVPLLLALNAHLAIAGKAPFEAFVLASSLVSTSDSDGSACSPSSGRVLWLLSQCLRALPADERTRCWFVECLVAAKRTASNQDHQLLRLQLCLLSLIALALSGAPLLYPVGSCDRLERDLWLLLPEALAALLLMPCWRDDTTVVLNWLSEMLALELQPDAHQLLLSCACRLRSTPEYSQACTELLSNLRA